MNSKFQSERVRRVRVKRMQGKLPPRPSKLARRWVWATKGLGVDSTVAS